MYLDATTQLAEYEIRNVVTGAEWRENCYVVRDRASQQAIVIDPGGDFERIVAALEGVVGLPQILLTHGHHDHVGAVAALARQFGVNALLHQGDGRLIRLAPTYALRFAKRQIEPPAPVQLFDGEPRLAIGERPIRVIHTPGHTQGGVCYDFGPMAFTGDTLLHRSVGRTDMPGGDRAALHESVNRLLDVLSPDVLMFPGHGRPIGVAEARSWWISYAQQSMPGDTVDAR